MSRREKIMLAVLSLALISWALEIYDVWPVLVAHLTVANWITLVLFHSAALFSLITFCARSKATPKQPDAILASILTAMMVILSWAYDFSLMRKISGP